MPTQRIVDDGSGGRIEYALTCGHCGKEFFAADSPVWHAGREGMSLTKLVTCCSESCAIAAADALNAPEYVVGCPWCQTKIAVN